MQRARILGLLLGVFVLAGCGGSALTGFDEIPLTNYPAGQEFRLTVVMTSCSDSCATYEEPSCSVDVDKDENTITVDATACYDRTGDMCLEICGPRILAHCTIPALASGTYTVKSDNISRTIDVR